MSDLSKPNGSDHRPELDAFLIEQQRCVDDLLGNHQYEAAIELLERQLKRPDKRSERLDAWAGHKLRELRNTVQKLRESSPPICATARQFLEKHDYASAVQILEQVPVVYRSIELRGLLEKSTELRDECQHLEIDIAEAVRTGDSETLPALVKRLSKLKPKNKAMKQLVVDIKNLGAAKVIAVRKGQQRFLDPAGPIVQPHQVIFSVIGVLLLFGVMSLVIRSYLTNSKPSNPIPSPETVARIDSKPVNVVPNPQPVGDIVADKPGPSTGDVRSHIRFVKRSAKPGGDGLTWATAYTDLQAALQDARAPGSAVDMIYVAQGKYAPGDSNASRDSTFELVNGVALFGGFEGTETDRSERKPGAYPTILSGDLKGDDEPGFRNRDENCFHVLRSRDGDESTNLDGFTVEGGNANGTGSDDDIYQSQVHGAGLLVVNSKLILRHCEFKDNTTSGSGGGLCTYQFAGRAYDCLFTGNSASTGGGVRNLAPVQKARSESIIFCRCRFTDNVARRGAGLENFWAPRVILANCVFQSNRTKRADSNFYGGAAFYIDSSRLMGVNCLIADNESDGFGGGAMIKFAGPGVRLFDSTFAKNRDGQKQGTDIYSWNGSKLSLANCVLWSDGVAAIETGEGCQTTVSNSCVRGDHSGPGNINRDPQFMGTVEAPYQLARGSPCIDAGDSSLVPVDNTDLNGNEDFAEPVPLDLNGNPRRIGAVDMGAFETSAP